MITVLVAAVIILISFLCIFLSQRSSVDLPGPRSLPLIGSLHLVNPQTPHLSLTKLAQKYGPIYNIKLGILNTVVISDAKLLKKVLIKDEATGRPPVYMLKTFLQNKGVAFSEGKLWKDQRKFAINFLKTSGALKNSSDKKHLENLIIKSAQEFVQFMKNEYNDISIIPTEAVAYYVNSVSSFLFLGKSWSRDDKEFKNLLHNLDEVIRLTSLGAPLNFLPFFRFLPKYKRTMNFIKKVQTDIHCVYEKNINEIKKKFHENDNISNIIQAFLLQMYKSNKNKIYSLEQLRFLVNDIFAASLETTTNSILWIILYLALYEKTQNQVRQELLEVLQHKAPTVDDLFYLPYTEATLAEIARIRTVVPLGFPHCALEDIFVDNVKIPKNSMIMPLLWAIHMDANVWRAPEKFCPERFLDDNGKFYQPESFIPFQSGKRRCLGDYLAKSVIFLFVATTLTNFKITSSEDASIDLDGVCGLTLSPKPQKLRFIKL